MIDTSPEPPASATIAPLPTDAVLEARTRLNASEPAIEFLPPPAPLVASAPKVLAESEPTGCVSDSRVRAPAFTCAPAPIEASVVRNARLTPTAAPTLVPVAGPVVVADPSALAVESVLPLAESLVSAVPLEMERPAGSVALCETSLIVTAIAAATWSGLLLPELSLSELSAFGVGLAPETLPEPLVPPTSPAFF